LSALQFHRGRSLPKFPRWMIALANKKPGYTQADIEDMDVTAGGLREK
jgi:hypothetical protein